MHHFRRLLYVSFLSLTLAASCKKDADDVQQKPVPGRPGTSTTFTNPLLPSGPDPWVYQQSDTYYYTHTLGNRIGLIKTKAVSQLSKETFATVWTPPGGEAYSQNIWAPEIHKLNGKWYIYFAADNGEDVNHRMYVLENDATDPTTGTWTLKGKLTPTTDRWAIDGSVFEHSGQLYFIWSGWVGNNDPGIQQIYIAKMTNPWTIEGDRVMITRPTFNWEMNGLVNEGPEVIKNAAGKVFMVYSASGCWTDSYSLGRLTLRDNGNPMNPDDWMKSPTPVLATKAQNNAFGPGHNGFFKSPDGTEDWIIYHANSFAEQGCGNTRSPRIQKFTWNADGTPNFGEPVIINTPLPRPSGEVK
ncbi:glycoside hydrolase family 43 protein [Rufibacter latericius]|uniref:Glycosyl hydrolase family 43 n=1 Tax=Rufibacter latericius TaxID=2487040 RepID=A0A3M9MVL2_9BACT|nr:glycoside hydrolase family 43 protein [Rufibacter latericius]RNI28808.1 glycosyl hydrolase family 43 [Rufibacter latericius]